MNCIPQNNRMRHLTAVLLILQIAAVTAFVAVSGTDVSSAEGGDCGDDLVWNISDDHKTLTISLKEGKTEGDMYDYDNDGNPAPWHAYAGSITQIILPDGLKGIGGYAFLDCTQITTVEIPEKATDIRAHAFANCSSLTAFTVRPSTDNKIVSDDLKQDENGFLYEILVTKTIREIKNVTLVMLPTGQFKDTRECTIDLSAMYEQTEKTLSDITNSSICDVINLEKVKFTSTKVDDATLSLGDMFFENKVIKEIVVEDSVGKVIPGQGDNWGCFENCTQLTTFTLPEGCEFDLSSNNITRLFRGCTSLTEITLKNTNSPNTSGVPAQCFMDCINLKTVRFDISGTGSIVGDSAFKGCTSLTEITFPETVYSLEAHVFQDCPNLATVNLSDTMRNLGFECFKGSNITSISIPAGLLYIEGGCFEGCKNLGSIDLPGLTLLGEYAFKDCTSLKSVSLGVLQEISGNQFFGCTALESVDFGSALTAIRGSAFNGCVQLTAIDLPEGLKQIDQSQFVRCGLVHELALPASLESIGAYAFDRCDGLSYISFGNAITDMGTQQFKSIKFYENGNEVTGDAQTLKGKTWVGSGTDKRLDNAAYGVNVTFSAEGGTSTSYLMTTVGGKLVSLPVPSKEGCTFTCWSKSATQVEKVTTDTVFSDPTTVYAVWTYTITFKNYDGSVIQTVSVAQGEVPSCTETPEKPPTDSEVYIFSGWVPAIVPATADATYTAAYTAEPIHIDGDEAEMDLSDRDTAVISEDVLDMIAYVSTLKIDLKKASVSLDGGIIDKLSAGQTIKVTDADRGKLTPEMQKLIGDRPVLDITIDGLSALGGKMTVSIPYGGQEKAGDLNVYCIKDDGTYETFKATYENGAVTFTTDHLSTYAIGLHVPGKSDNTPLILAVVAIAIVAQAAVGLILYKRSKSE